MMADGTIDGHYTSVGSDLEESQVDTSAKSDIFSSAANTTSENDKVNDDRERMRKENEKIKWIQIRKILLGLLAQFAIAKGIEHHDATIAGLEPTATTITRRTSIENVSTRLLVLQSEILAGNIGKEQGEELGNLIADAIFSRKKDAKPIVELKEDAIRAKKAAEYTNTLQNLEEMAVLLEEKATLHARKWLLARLQEGLEALKPGKTGLEWVSKLHDEYF